VQELTIETDPRLAPPLALAQNASYLQDTLGNVTDITAAKSVRDNDEEHRQVIEEV
jgi:hypothetical protein